MKLRIGRIFFVAIVLAAVAMPSVALAGGVYIQEADGKWYDAETHELYDGDPTIWIHNDCWSYADRIGLYTNGSSLSEAEPLAASRVATPELGDRSVGLPALTGLAGLALAGAIVARKKAKT